MVNETYNIRIVVNKVNLETQKQFLIGEKFFKFNTLQELAFFLFNINWKKIIK